VEPVSSWKAILRTRVAVKVTKNGEIPYETNYLKLHDTISNACGSLLGKAIGAIEASATGAWWQNQSFEDMDEKITEIHRMLDFVQNGGNSQHAKVNSDWVPGMYKKAGEERGQQLGAEGIRRIARHLRRSIISASIGDTRFPVWTQHWAAPEFHVILTWWCISLSLLGVLSLAGAVNKLPGLVFWSFFFLTFVNNVFAGYVLASGKPFLHDHASLGSLQMWLVVDKGFNIMLEAGFASVATTMCNWLMAHNPGSYFSDNYSRNVVAGPIFIFAIFFSVMIYMFIYLSVKQNRAAQSQDEDIDTFFGRIQNGIRAQSSYTFWLIIIALVAVNSFQKMCITLLENYTHLIAVNGCKIGSIDPCKGENSAQNIISAWTLANNIFQLGGQIWFRSRNFNPQLSERIFELPFGQVEENLMLFDKEVVDYSRLQGINDELGEGLKALKAQMANQEGSGVEPESNWKTRVLDLVKKMSFANKAENENIESYKSRINTSMLIFVGFFNFGCNWATNTYEFLGIELLQGALNRAIPCVPGSQCSFQPGYGWKGAELPGMTYVTKKFMFVAMSYGMVETGLFFGVLLWLKWYFSADMNRGSTFRITFCLWASIIIILFNILPAVVGWFTSGFIPNVVTALGETSGVYTIGADGESPEKQQDEMDKIRWSIQKQLGAKHNDSTMPSLWGLNWSAIIVAMEGVSMFAMSQIQGIAATKTEDIELAITAYQVYGTLGRICASIIGIVVSPIAPRSSGRAGTAIGAVFTVGWMLTLVSMIFVGILFNKLRKENHKFVHDGEHAVTQDEARHRRNDEAPLEVSLL
jgi:hypothetical protein